jgi:cellobiose epimerase
MMDRIRTYKKELQKELDQILWYWSEHAVDQIHGGFYGKIDALNRVYPEAPKGIVLNSRILWTFSAAFNRTQNPAYLDLAKRAYHYIVDHFLDREYGGVYWSVDYRGEKLSDRKQIYGVAFCIYGLSEYHRASGEPAALDLAIALVALIERHAFDRKRKGYFEAFDRPWNLLGDLRLSEKDINEKKTLNTHLHIIEAYANLFKIWPDATLKQQIENLLEVFAHHFIQDETHHLNLFFDEHWNVKSTTISFGHDIEAAWLLQETAEVIDHPGWTITMKSLALKIADAASLGLDELGGLNYEWQEGLQVNEKHWWPQAEAMIGFFNAYQVSGDEKYLHRSLDSWQFVNKFIKDHVYGEWYWGLRADYSLMEGFDKAGFWKCPYHNARACMEICYRIERIHNLQE